MEAYNFCQSCGRPLNRPDVLGTEKDGSKSTIYCIECYRDGVFTDEDMTLEKMDVQVRTALREVGASETAIQAALARLPSLSRWLGIPAIHHNFEWH